MRRLAPPFLLLLGILGAAIPAGCGKQFPYPSAAATGPGEYLFCFWNVENLFDDHLDDRTGPGDREYDRWFADNPEILKQKLAKLSEALIDLNQGKGPDILAVCEVESRRAAELLQKALNDRLADSKLHYSHVLMKEIHGGRHIAPAILTRLPVIADKTQAHGNRQRILEGHITVDGHELNVIASHWTSQINEGSERGRASYADKIYGAANAIFHRNRSVDLLICGDFNTTPDDAAVTEHLHATGDMGIVRNADQLRLLNLLAGKDPAKFGTHYYKHPLIYDQIVVSPGMLDSAGWSCDPNSVQVVQSLRRPGDRQVRPWRFGGPNEHGPRGYSDHFPVTVRLKVER